jgi:tetratricopeptide (TPR) repeat protein
LAAALLILLAGYAFRVHNEAGLLAEREQARHQLSEFRRLADEAQFFAANTDAISERVPYYEPRRAMEAGTAALAIAAPWGDRANGLPLTEERAEFLRSQYALVLLMAQAKLKSLAPDDSPQQALTLLDRARTMGPPSRGYFAIRSECLASLGESQAAQLERERASGPATPVTAQDHFLAGEQLRLRDAGASGRAVTEMIDERADLRREHLNAALDEYRQALALDPQHYWARFQTGRCLLALGRTPEAIGVLSGCVALRPASPWAYTTRGLANAIAGRSDDAMRDLDEAIRLDPAFRPAQLNRGVVHWLRHENEPAIADFTTALGASDARRLDEAAYYRGQVLLDERREHEAVADFSTVLADRPDFQLAYWFRAQANYRLGDADAGLTDVKKFVALSPLRQPNAAPAEERLALGKALRKLAQQLPEAARPKPLSSARDELQAAIEAGPPRAEMWEQLGAVHELSKTPSKAIDAYSRGLALSPDDVRLGNLRAWAYVGGRQFELAKADFANVLRTAPNDPEAHAGLGFVLAELGHEDAARREASTALLVAADNQLILHNVACIYGRLSASQPERKIEYENVALASLQRAASISREAFLGIDADERALIRSETVFPASLKARPEFQRLVSGGDSYP